MKKIVSLLLVFLLSITIIGCENKEEEKTKRDKDNVVEKEEVKEEKIPTLTLDKIYGDKNNLYNGGSLTTLNLGSDGSVTYSNCGKEAGCYEARGTYIIEDTKLIVSLTEKWDYGEWFKFSEPSVETYTITADNTFILDNQEFVIDR